MIITMWLEVAGRSVAGSKFMPRYLIIHEPVSTYVSDIVTTNGLAANH